MAKNWMVEYVGPKKLINVPFPEDGSFPLTCLSDPHVTVSFPKKQPVELTPAQGKVILKHCPESFKLLDQLRVTKPKTETIRAPKADPTPVVQEITEEEFEAEYGEGDQDSARQDSGPAQDN